MSTTITARELQEGQTITLTGVGRVTVDKITRRDPSWVSNGVVYFTAASGDRYGVDALTRFTVEEVA